VTDLAIKPQGGDESVSTTAGATSSEHERQIVEQLSPEGGTESDDTAEIEHEGQTYRVPNALKGAFLAHADHARKTQDLGDRDASLKQQAQTHAEHVNGIGRLLAYDDMLARYEQLDWQSLRAGHPFEAQTLWSQYVSLKNQKAAAATELQAKLLHWQQTSEADAAKRRECQSILSRDIKGWSPELYGKVQDFGMREFGFTPQEVASVTDARLIKVLHRAMIGEEAIKKAAAEARTARQQGLKPVPQVGSSAAATRWSPSDPASDKVSTAEWMKRRTEELRKQR